MVDGGPEFGVEGICTVDDRLLVRPINAAFGIPKKLDQVLKTTQHVRRKKILFTVIKLLVLF